MKRGGSVRPLWELAYPSSQEGHRLDRGAAGRVMTQVAMNCGCSMQEVARVLTNGAKLNRRKGRR